MTRDRKTGGPWWAESENIDSIPLHVTWSNFYKERGLETPTSDAHADQILADYRQAIARRQRAIIRAKTVAFFMAGLIFGWLLTEMRRRGI